MRSLLLILKLLLATALVVQSAESWAMSAKVKTHSKKSVKKTLQDSGDIWERIRSGMQIPRSFPNQTVLMPVQGLSTNTTIAQKNTLIKTTVLTPESKIHHDETNRSRLHSVIGRPRLSNDELSKQNAIIEAVNSNGRIKSKLRPNSSKNEAVAMSDNNKKTTGKLNAAKEELRKQIEDYVNTASSDSTVVSSRVRTSIESRKNTDDVVIQASTSKAQANSTTKTTTNKTKEDVSAQMIRVNTASERIGKHIAWYAQHSAYLQQVAERARPYLYHIVSQLSSNRLPPELALLPIVESAYQATAESPKSAAGLWQFIPSTGLDFDLVQTEHYDERLDIEQSTQAAIRYLSILRQHYGDWLLALAAYNCGQGRVDDAIAQNRANGLATDYWSLHLPEETQEYVPRFLALASIFSNPKSYKLKLPSIKNEPYFVKVKVNDRFAINYLANKELSDIAQLADLSHEQFMRLNPGYLKSKVATDAPFTLLLPANNAKQLHQHLDYVARFLDTPKTTLAHSNAPLKSRVTTEESQKTLPVAIVSSIHEKPKVTSPLISLKLTKQTTPRIMPQPLFDFSLQLAPSA